MSGEPRILVVGAGAAGISSTHCLYQAGFRNVTILEASDRIGGRIHTVRLEESSAPIELGANWIHGDTRDNSMFELALDAGVLRPYRYHNHMSAKFLKEDGSEIKRRVVAKSWETFQKVTDRLSDWARNPNVSPNNTKVLQEFFPLELAKELENVADLDKDDTHLAFQAMLNWLRFHNGDELDKMACIEYREYQDIPGGNAHVPCGYSHLLEILLKPMRSDTVKFGKEVTGIKWKVNGKYPVQVTANGTEVYEADHVIVTCSLGYLNKHYSTMFSPPLPDTKVTAIEKLGFGRVNKTFLQFERPLCHIKPRLQSAVFAWQDCDGPVDRHNWYKRIFGFHEIYNKPDVLLGWVSGDGAEVLESLSEEEVAQTCIKVLRQFWNEETIPDPVKTLVTHWGSNPYILGSYSYQKPTYTLDTRKTLAEPLIGQDDLPRVLFAGEATHPHYMSTTHGARSSGLREAERIIQLYRNTPAANLSTFSLSKSCMETMLSLGMSSRY